MKKIISIFVVISILVCSVINVSAATKTITMDNDALPSSGTTNPPADDGGFRIGCFGFDYVVGPNHYNDDARRTPKSRINATYAWQNTFPSSTYRVRLSAWLWDPLFTDTNAQYSLGEQVLDYVNFAKFNQNIAPGGWNVIGTVNYKSIYGDTVSVSPGYPATDERTGADAVKVECTY